MSWAIKVLGFTLVWAGSSFFPPRQGNMDLNDGINLSFYSCVPSRTVYEFFCPACLKNAHSRDFAFFEIFILFCKFFFNVLETFLSKIWKPNILENIVRMKSFTDPICPQNPIYPNFFPSRKSDNSEDGQYIKKLVLRSFRVIQGHKLRKKPKKRSTLKLH